MTTTFGISPDLKTIKKRNYIDIGNPNDIKSIKDIPSFDENPFTKDFTFSKRKYYQKVDNATIQINEFIISNDSIKSENLVFAEKLYKDNEPFCKVFINQDYIDFETLSGSGCKVFLFMIKCCINLNVDFVILNPVLLSERLKISSNTIYDVIVEFSKCNIIRKKNKEQNIYWFNPYVFFRGDRKKIKHRKIL